MTTTSATAVQEDPAAAEWYASHDGVVVERFPASGAASDTPGLAYHTQGVFRGADLSPLFRAKPAA